MGASITECCVLLVAQPWLVPKVDHSQEQVPVEGGALSRVHLCIFTCMYVRICMYASTCMSATMYVYVGTGT